MIVMEHPLSKKLHWWLCTHGAVPTAVIATGFYGNQSRMGGRPRLSRLLTAHLSPKRGPDRKEGSAVGPRLSPVKSARGDPSLESFSDAGTLQDGNKGVWPYSLIFKVWNLSWAGLIWSPGWPGTHRDPPAPAFRVVRLKVCAMTPGFQVVVLPFSFIYLCVYVCVCTCRGWKTILRSVLSFYCGFQGWNLDHQTWQQGLYGISNLGRVDDL